MVALCTIKFKVQEDRQRTYNVPPRRDRITPVAAKKNNKCFKFWVCVCIHASVTRHSKRMCRIILSCLAHLPVSYSSGVSHKRHDFRNMLTEHKTFWFSLKFYLKCFSLWEEFGETLSSMYIGIHVQSPICLTDFKQTRLLSTDFSKNYQIS